MSNGVNQNQEVKEIEAEIETEIEVEIEVEIPKIYKGNVIIVINMGIMLEIAPNRIQEEDILIEGDLMPPIINVEEVEVEVEADLEIIILLGKEEAIEMK